MSDVSDAEKRAALKDIRSDIASRKFAKETMGPGKRSTRDASSRKTAVLDELQHAADRGVSAIEVARILCTFNEDSRGFFTVYTDERSAKTASALGKIGPEAVGPASVVLESVEI